MAAKNFENIYKIELPVPFPIKTTNVYVISEDPITIIDTGIKTEESFESLNKELRKIGLGIESIKRILITHGHSDHYGQAKRISHISNSQIFIHPKEYGRIRSFIHQFGYLKSVLLRNGLPAELVEKIIHHFESGQKWSDSLEEAFFLNEGDSINFRSMKLKTLHCPGHSPGMLCFYIKEKRILFTGDQLLKSITPNPILYPEGLNPPYRYPSLKNYLASLQKIEKLNLSMAFPGHGEEISDPTELIKKIYIHHEERIKQVLSSLSNGEKTAFEITLDLFPHINGFEIFLGISEILGHLEILLEKGLVRVREKDSKDYYLLER